MITKPKMTAEDKFIYDSWLTDEMFLLFYTIVNRKGKNGKRLPMAYRKAELADFLYRATCNVIAQTKGTDFADPNQFINTKDCPEVAVDCPKCGHTFAIDMIKLAKDIAKAEKKATGEYRCNHDRVMDDVLKATKAWNKQSAKKVPYEFVEWLKEKI